MQSVDAPLNRKRKAIGTALITLGAILLLGSATAKLAQVPPVVNQLAAAGFSPSKVMFIAFLEVFSAALFLVPATGAGGLLVVSAFVGGAIATHLQHSQSIVQPSIILLLIWFGAWLRHPEILWSRKAFHRADIAQPSREAGEAAR